MADPRLNYDVLIAVLQAVARWGRKPDLVRIMQTCRTLQHAGAPLLIRDGVDIKRVKSMRSFCSFMLADHTRFRYLRRLTLSVPGLRHQQELDAVLARVFRRARNLEQLYISDPEFLECYFAVFKAITELTELKLLHLSEGNCCRERHLRDMLWWLGSDIHSLAVSFGHIRIPTLSGEVIRLLEGVAPHLERLDVRYASFESTDGPQYPRLKVLTCDKGTRMNLCGPLIRAFPNLAYLDVSNSLLYETDLEPWRLANTAAQQTLRWHHLSYLSGKLPSLYGLALQCLVTMAEIEVEEGDEPTMLPAVLSDIQPVNLTITVDYEAPFTFMLPDMFLGTARRLDHLTMSIDLADGEQLNPQQFFDSILLTLRATQLTFFRLDLMWSEPSELKNHSIEPHPITQQPLDPTTCAERLMDHIATIKVIVLDWAPCSQPGPFAAVIDEIDGVRSLKILDEAATDELCAQVRLHMYRDVPEPFSQFEMFTSE